MCFFFLGGGFLKRHAHGPPKNGRFSWFGGGVKGKPRGEPRLCVGWFVCLFVRWFVRSFVCLFVCFWVRGVAP